MTYIPFISQDDLVLDNQQKRLVGGKIEVLDPISNNPVDIFVYDGSNDDYIVSTNPIYLDVNSRPEHTYFSTQLVLCRLYKYIGNFSDPMVDDDTNNWEFVREWNGSFHENEQKNDTIVYGFSSIQDANTALGSITVVGYWNNYDCEARTYVWDANCVQTPDNGYIVKANGIDTGRWILKFDGEYLPSTYYGVYPGHEANINALLSYVESVGTAGTKTAPGVYFVPGTYNESTVALATSKKLLIDAKTSFTRESIQADDVKVIGGQITAPICDFFFNETNTNHNISEAHSSWYKSVHKFLISGAKKLIVDNENNFTDLKLSSNISLENKIIVANKRIPIDYNGCYIIFNRCTIVGEKWINANSDYIQFRYMNITDRWFTSTNVNSFDVGRIANGNHIEASSMLIDTLSLSNFDSAAIWLKWQIANGVTEIDLEGRTVNTINYNEITKLVNAKFNTLTYADNVGSLTLYNCEGTISNMVVRYLTVNKSTLSFDGQPICNVGTLAEFVDSTIKQSALGIDNGWKNSATTVRATNCAWSVSIDYTNNDNTTAQVAEVAFVKCTLNQSNNYLRLKRCNFEDCVLNNQIIKIYPYKATGVDSAEHYFMGSTFMNNKITGNYPIELTKYDDDNCFNVYFNGLMFVGNTMYNGTGIECRYWQNRYGNNAAEKFIAPVLWFNDPIYATVQGHSFSYKNNIGNCPQENFKNMITTKAAFTQEYQWPSYNTNTTDTQRIFPPLNQSISNSPLYHSAGPGTLNNLMEIGYMPQTWDESGTYVPGDSHYYGYFGENYYFQADYDLPLFDDSSNPVGNGSLFNIGPAVGNTTVLGYDNMKAVVYIA